MNLRDLTYLIALADYRHFGKASEACYVSQPALSMQIKKLESYLGVQLLERTNKSVLLTEIGTLLAEQARQILIQVDELKETAKLAKNHPYNGELKIGIIPTLAPYLLPIIMPSLISAYPKLAIYWVEEKTTFIVKQLKDGKLDAAILALPTEGGLTSSPLFEEKFLLAIPKGHRLSTKKLIKQSDLADENLLLLDEGHCLRDQALTICKATQAREHKKFRATSLETLRHMVMSGIGLTLIPKLAIPKPSSQSNHDIVYLEFNQPKPSRIIGMQWRASSAKGNLLDKIASVVKKTTATVLASSALSSNK